MSRRFRAPKGNGEILADPPFAPASFDAVMAVDLVEHVPDIAQGFALGEDVVNSRHITDGFNAQMNRGMTLRIEIQQQYAFSACRQPRRDVDAGGRLPNAALLIHDTNRAHRSPFQSS